MNLFVEMIGAPRRLATTLAAVTVLLARGTLAAQETLTLDRAVQDALAQNASLRAARAGVAEGAEGVVEARSEWFPRISVAESWQRGDDPVFVFSSLLSARRFAAANFAIDALNHPDATGFFRSSVTVEQLVFDGGRRRSATESASSRQEISQLMLDEASAALVLTTTQTYGRIVAAESRHRAADASLLSAKEDLARAERRRDTGMATDADVLALVAHVADLQQGSIEYQGDAAVARAELNRLMGVPIGREYLVTLPSGAADLTIANMNLDALLAEADAARPELRRAAAAEHLADSEHKGARGALIPQVAAQGGVDWSGTSFTDRASAWIVGAEVRWNLSLGGAEVARMKAASQAQVRAAAEAEDTRAAVHVEVATAFRRLEAAGARLAAGRAAVNQAGESQRIVRDRFEAGLAGVTDVLRASTAVLDAERQRIAAVVDAIVSQAMLNRALGRRP